MAETIRVLRVIEYTGPRSEVETQVTRSLHGEKRLPNGVTIKAATVGTYPELLENLKETPQPFHDSSFPDEHGPYCTAANYLGTRTVFCGLLRGHSGEHEYVRAQ